MSRYEVGLCQRFNQEIHGFHPSTSSPEIMGHHICLFTFDFTCMGLYESYVLLAKYYNATIEIVDTLMLHPGDEMVAIYKTVWLRIFQRMCKRWLRQRRFARSSRMYSYLLKREYEKTNISL
jgi:hypothetical protein